jgi:hypothetical protein
MAVRTIVKDILKRKTVKVVLKIIKWGKIMGLKCGKFD